MFKRVQPSTSIMHCSDDISPWQSNKKHSLTHQKHVLLDMHLIIDGCDTVKTLEAIFVRGYCIVGSPCTLRMELISCRRSVQVRHMNSPIYGSGVVLWMKAGGEISKVVRSEIVWLIEQIFKGNVDYGYHVKRFSETNKFKKPRWAAFEQCWLWVSDKKHRQ